MTAPRLSATAVALLSAGAVVLGACGSASTLASAAPSQACRSVDAVLSDGPDPSADPVGYAEAQILPLRQVRTSDRAVMAAVHLLDEAYEQVFSTDGNARATQAVALARARLDALCPGAAP